MRTLWLQCTNILCGAAYRGCVEIQYQYSPSACPSPDFQLPPPPRHVIKADRRALYEQDSGGQLDLIHQLEDEEEDSITTTTGNVE